MVRVFGLSSPADRSSAAVHDIEAPKGEEGSIGPQRAVDRGPPTEVLANDDRAVRGALARTQHQGPLATSLAWLRAVPSTGPACRQIEPERHLLLSLVSAGIWRAIATFAGDIIRQCVSEIAKADGRTLWS